MLQLFELLSSEAPKLKEILMNEFEENTFNFHRVMSSVYLMIIFLFFIHFVN